MATVIRNQIGQWPQSLPPWKLFFERLNCPTITITEDGDYLYILIGGIATLTLYFDGGDYLRSSVTYLGTTTSLASCRGVCLATVCFTDNLFYFQLDGYDHRRYLLLYEKIGDDKLFGFYSPSGLSNPFISIRAVELKNYDTLQICSHGIVLPYAATDPNSIIYADGDILVYNSVRNFTNTEFTSCSTIVHDQVLTFNGRSYYAVGANNLIMIDN